MSSKKLSKRDLRVMRALSENEVLTVTGLMCDCGYSVRHEVEARLEKLTNLGLTSARAESSPLDFVMHTLRFYSLTPAGKDALKSQEGKP
jgi:hypothetical protein